MSAAIYSASQRCRPGPARSRRRHVPTILVVDDEQPLLAMVREILEDEGLTVLTARQGREALEVAARTRPDLILTDLMMPVMSGRVLHERLRDDPAMAPIPVVLMTAAYRPQPGDTFAAVVAKPFEIDDLLRQVYQHVTG